MVNHIRKLARHQRPVTHVSRASSIRRNSTRQHRPSSALTTISTLQVINDESGATVCACDSLQKGLVEGSGGNIDAAKAVGQKIAELALAQGIAAVTLDRVPYRYTDGLRLWRIPFGLL